MNTRISDAAVEAGCSKSGIASRAAMRIALEDAIPHLQPAKPEAVRLRDELRERAAFEAWSRDNFGSIDLSRHDSGEYRHARTRNDWDLWQAALASVQPSPAGEKWHSPLAKVAAVYGFTGTWEQIGDALIAARQPLGENPAWRDELVREAYNRGLADDLNADRQPAEGPLLTLDSGVQLPLVRNGDNYRLDPAIGQPARAVEQPNDPGRTLYIDLDGVMADFDGAFPAVFGLDHRSLADDEMWGHINSHPSFFRDLPPMAGALDFFRSVEHLNPVILTACPKSNYPHVATQKRAWVRAHLSQTCMVLPVLGGRHKPLFMHQAGDVLIDDFGKNCAAWTDAGGIAIKHEGDWTATQAALALIDSGKAVQS